jgi:hypothetical protein
VQGTIALNNIKDFPALFANQKHHSFATAMNLRNHHFNRILRFPKKAKKMQQIWKKGQFRQKEMQEGKKKTATNNEGI